MAKFGYLGIIFAMLVGKNTASITSEIIMLAAGFAMA